ncbi:putative salicylaldehyde dehydrogenase [Diaporthe sp. PMI_573]|nr:putative salicylaldehyde dehydrogenase [Diaporthaceae sp. PMI_573]KAH8746069.1 putative salicylaldehyde dehydrogenase [Diaporthaceae sp. PMI_573]
MATNTVPLLIDGIALQTEESFSVLNPNDGSELWKAFGASAAEAEKAAAAAQAAFPVWSGLNYLERRTLLNKAADQMAECLEEMKKYVTLETAAGPEWTAFDCENAIQILREVACRQSTIQGDSPPLLDTQSTALVEHVPYGVMLGIAPWNAAALLGVRSVAYALAAGNTVVLKASELCPRTLLLLGECFHKVGVPPGVVNVVAHGPEKGPEVIGALIKHSAVKKINFTGSTAVGRIIAGLAAKELKPVLLELGGKAPLVVLDDADLEGAASATAGGSNLHAGQVCMATERVIVLGSVAARFEEILKQTYAKLYPPGVNHQASMRPSGAKKQSRLYREESFGPVVAFIVVPTVEEAIAVANDTEYGLSAAVWGSLPKALAVARKIHSGAVHINGSTIHDEPTLPHGGMKSTGYGRFGSSWGISEFLTTRTITFKV